MMAIRGSLKAGRKPLSLHGTYVTSSAISLRLLLWLPWVIRGCYFVDSVEWSWLEICFLLLFALFFPLSPKRIELSLSLSMCLCWLCLKIEESDKWAKWLSCDSIFLTCLTLFIPVPALLSFLDENLLFTLFVVDTLLIKWMFPPPIWELLFFVCLCLKGDGF